MPRATPRWVGGVAVAIAVVLGVDVFLLAERTRSSPVSFEEALGAFRGRDASALATGPGPAVRDVKPVVAVPGAGGAPRSAPGASVVGTRVASSAAAAAKAPSSTAPYTLPLEGVYSYRTTGGESISVVGARHDYPERTFATVRHLGGCRWEQRNDVVKEHVDRREMCSSPRKLLQLAQAREVEFFHKRDGDSYRCDPPQLQHEVAEVPGAVSMSVCGNGKDDGARIRRTFVGRETLQVGSRAVPVLRLDFRATLTGWVMGVAR
jgi:hypothetical protein